MREKNFLLVSTLVVTSVKSNRKVSIKIRELEICLVFSIYVERGDKGFAICKYNHLK